MVVVCNNEYSDVFSSDIYYLYEDVIERKDYFVRCKLNSGVIKRGKVLVILK